MQADRFVEVNGETFAVIEDPKSGVDCLFPIDGECSLDAIIAEFGDDLDVVLQSASSYIPHEE